MHKRALHICFVSLAFLMSVVSCVSKSTPSLDKKVVLSVGFVPVETKSSNTVQTSDETRINTLEVFVFDFSSDEKPKGTLDGYKKAVDSEILSRSIDIDVSTGIKHIYAIANAPSGLEERVHCEEDLLSETMRLSDNRRDSLVMVGSPCGETNLVAGVSGSNKVHINLKRMVSRVIVGNIRASFISPALERSDVRLGRVYLSDVTSELPLVNGDVFDVFGTAENNKEYEMSGNTFTIPYFYEFRGTSPLCNPIELVTFPDGRRGIDVSSDANVHSLTCVDIPPEDGMLCSSGGEGSLPSLENHLFSVEGGLSLYAFPNCNDFSENPDGTVEGHPTMLVLEVFFGETLTYYSFNMGYLQPNYSYTVTNIRLSRAGTSDPAFRVSTTSASCTITVADWLSGEVISSYGTSVVDGEIDFK